MIIVAPSERVRYRERQVVTATDLSIEQSYLIAGRQRHNVTTHGWGVVAGLGLELLADDLVVAPGFAVNGHGQELVLAQAVHVTADELAGKDGGAGVAVWLRYREQDVPSLGRTLEGAEVEPAPFFDGIDPRLYDLELVYLGRVDRARHAIDTSGRPFAGLAGTTVAAVSNDAAIQLGETFSIRISGNEAWKTDAGGNATVAGNASVDGELLLAVPDDPESERGALVFSKPVPRPAASPWSIYHTAAALVENGPPVDQLRIEIADPGKKSDPSTWLLAVGQMIAGAFQPCLSVAADRTVTVSGDLVVEGLILEGPVTVDPDDPRLTQAVRDKWLGGVTEGSADLDEFYTGGLTLVIDATPLSYTITVSNGSTSLLTDVHVWDAVARGATFLRDPRDVESAGFPLAGGEQRTFTGAYPPGATGSVRVSASAFGLAPSNRIVQTEASADTVIPARSPS